MNPPIISDLCSIRSQVLGGQDIDLHTVGVEQFILDFRSKITSHPPILHTVNHFLQSIAHLFGYIHQFLVLNRLHGG